MTSSGPTLVERGGATSSGAGNGCITVMPVRGGGNDCWGNAKSVSSPVSLLIGGRRLRTASVSALDNEVDGASFVAGRASGWSVPSLKRKRKPSSSSEVFSWTIVEG